jgi:DNA-directed RNA polymerase subunit beta'
VVPDKGEAKEYLLPRGVHVSVQESERVKAGEPLMEGPRNPHDILAVLGEKELQKYLVDEIQEVYRRQGVNLNDKHIEVMVRQRMRWVKVEDVGRVERGLESGIHHLVLTSLNRAIPPRLGSRASALL